MLLSIFLKLVGRLFFPRITTVYFFFRKCFCVDHYACRSTASSFLVITTNVLTDLASTAQKFNSIFLFGPNRFVVGSERSGVDTGFRGSHSRTADAAVNGGKLGGRWLAGDLLPHVLLLFLDFVVNMADG